MMTICTQGLAGCPAGGFLVAYNGKLRPSIRVLASRISSQLSAYIGVLRLDFNCRMEDFLLAERSPKGCQQAVKADATSHWAATPAPARLRRYASVRTMLGYYYRTKGRETRATALNFHWWARQSLIALSNHRFPCTSFHL